MYKSMFNQYGIPTVAEKKFVKFVKGIIVYKGRNKRIALFASFIGVIPYNEGEFEFYLKGLYYMVRPRYSTPSQHRV